MTRRRRGIAGYCDGIAVAGDGSAVTTRCGVDGTQRSLFSVADSRMAALRKTLAAIDDEDLEDAVPCEPSPANVVDGMTVFYEIEGVGPICSGTPEIDRLIEATSDLLLRNRAGLVS